MDANITVPRNNNNLWELVSSGLIDENDVFENGKIINQEYINYLMSLNIINESTRNIYPTQTLNNIESRRPRSNHIRRNRTVSHFNRNNIFVPNIQDTPRASRQPANYHRTNNHNNHNISNQSSLLHQQREREDREIQDIQLDNVEEISINTEIINNIEDQNNINTSSSLLCVICLTNERKYIITPCNHFCVCNTCSTRVQYENKCPICRRRNIRIQEIYY